MKIDCYIVEDLLPLYLEKMVSDETYETIKVHLNSCENCKKKYDIMKTGELNINLTKENNFKSYRNQLLIFLVVGIILQIIFSLIYYKIFFVTSGNILLDILVSLYLFMPIISFLSARWFSKKKLLINIIAIILFAVASVLIPYILLFNAYHKITKTVLFVLTAYSFMPFIIGFCMEKIFRYSRRKK